MGEIGRERMCLEDYLALARAGFTDAYGPGGEPRVFFAPGRVNLIGAHVDYNGGPVLPLAIDRGTWVLARPRARPFLALASDRGGPRFQLPLDELPDVPQGEWFDYPVGVARQLVSGAGRSLEGVELYFAGDLPVGAGLSSSASLCVAAALAMGASWDLDLEPEVRARVAWQSEQDYVGIPCGPMDPLAIGLAQADSVLWLDCGQLTHEHIRVDPAAFSLLVVDSGVRRKIASSAYAMRVAECERAFEVLRRHQRDASHLAQVETVTLERAAEELGAVELRRARHVVEEVARTRAARLAIEAGCYPELGALMFATHESLRGLYDVSCDELDFIVDTAGGLPGVHGARLVGAGFGGCVVALLEPEAGPAVGEELAARFTKRFGRSPALEPFRCSAGSREILSS
jgi:galactokinase